ncbi:conserved hypothetical protein [Trichinella spiralis]|uniref:hypothetical protein n=1 Tax=Trichinella spiralis TaxID=6334 RepID=UPI0001EFB32D|nr:conserved hypothetical protein [Trichinella spiralis]
MQIKVSSLFKIKRKGNSQQQQQQMATASRHRNRNIDCSPVAVVNGNYAMDERFLVNKAFGEILKKMLMIHSFSLLGSCLPVGVAVDGMYKCMNNNSQAWVGFM